jgi:HEAT repeat protein
MISLDTWQQMTWKEAQDAVDALVALDDPDTVATLIYLFEHVSNISVKNALAVGLRDLGDDAAIPALLAQAKDPTYAGRNGTFVYALQTLDARAFVVDLAELLCSGDYEVIVMGIMTMRAWNGPLDGRKQQEAATLLKRCLDDEPEDWRRDLLMGAYDVLQEHDAV